MYSAPKHWSHWVAWLEGETGNKQISCVTDKRVTIPRLDLNSAVLLTKLMHKVKTALNVDIRAIFY